MWPPGYGQIHTSSQAGGMTSSSMRPSTSRSTTGSPSLSRYSQRLPLRTRRIPGPVQSERRSLTERGYPLGPDSPLGGRGGLLGLRRRLLLGGGLLGGPAPAAVGADGVQRGLQGGHEVGNRSRLLDLGLHGDLLAAG